MDARTEPANRSSGISWNELVALDPRPAPASLTDLPANPLGVEPLDAKRYTSEEFAALEREKMWPHVWQFAAREEDMPEDGDYVVYDNAGRSFLLIRQEDGSVRAFRNVCLHRGRALKEGDGWSNQIQCAFHGFTWNNDGTLRNIPCRWDFNHLKDEEMRLPEVEVGRWGGYIFVRDEPGGPTLEEYLAPVPDHFERWRHDQCTTVAWAAKEVKANWKVTVEAFMEAWHSITTHPQILSFTGDANSAYGIHSDHVSVSFVPFGIPSPHLAPNNPDEQSIVDAFLGLTLTSEAAATQPSVVVPSGTTARRALADHLRKAFAEASGRDLEHATDAEVLDAIVYNVFPNFSPWGGFMPNIVYRWKPGSTADTCIMEIRILSRVPEGQPIPRGVPMRMLGPDESWGDYAEMGNLGLAIDQDQDNLPHVQKGLKSRRDGKVHLGNYQELRIRHFHQTLDKYLVAQRD